MECFASTSVLLATLALGLSAGALITEAGILVPYWRSLQPEEFLSWYRQHASLLVRFFGSLEVVSTLLVVAAALLSGFTGRPGSGLLGLSAGLTLLVLAAFPLYFQRANASFSAGTIAVDAVARELRRWSSWHWVRTLVAIGAFVAAALALGQASVSPTA